MVSVEAGGVAVVAAAAAVAAVEVHHSGPGASEGNDFAAAVFNGRPVPDLWQICRRHVVTTVTTIAAAGRRPHPPTHANTIAAAAGGVRSADVLHN